MLCDVADPVGVIDEIEFADACLSREVQPVELHPDEIGASGGLEVVDPVGQIRDGAPAGGGNVRPGRV